MISKVMGVPAWSSSRRAWMALARVNSRRLRAAVTIAVVSGGIGHLLPLAFVGLKRGNDLFEVVGDLPVHLHHAVLAAGFGCGDDLQGLLSVLSVLRQELDGGEEHRACQAGVGVGARLHQGKSAVAVG